MKKLIDILNEMIEEKDDRCLRIARRKYSKPSAYRSGAIVRCRQGKIWKGVNEKDNTLNENSLKITPAQLKKLNKRLKDKGYSDYEFGLVNNTPKAYYTFWRREPTREEAEQLSFLQGLVHQSTNFNDLYYSI